MLKLKEKKKREREWRRRIVRSEWTTTRGPPHAYCEQLIFKRINWRDWHADDSCIHTRLNEEKRINFIIVRWKISWHFSWCFVLFEQNFTKKYYRREWRKVSLKSHKDFLSSFFSSNLFALFIFAMSLHKSVQNNFTTQQCEFEWWKTFALVCLSINYSQCLLSLLNNAMPSNLF